MDMPTRVSTSRASASVAEARSAMLMTPSLPRAAANSAHALDTPTLRATRESARASSSGSSAAAPPPAAKEGGGVAAAEEGSEKAAAAAAGAACVTAPENEEATGRSGANEGDAVVPRGAASLAACCMKCDRASMTSVSAGRMAGFESQHRCIRLATCCGT